MNEKNYVFTWYTQQANRREYKVKATDFEAAKVQYGKSQQRLGTNIQYKAAHVIEEGKRVKIQ